MECGYDGAVFVALSKTLDLAVTPVAWVIALLLAALLARRRKAASTALVALAVAVLYLFSTSAVANALTRALESSARTTMRPDVTYDAVIVLSGMVDDASSLSSGRPELNAAADRILAGYDVLRQGRARDILLTGGPVHPTPGAPTEPDWLAGMLRAWGVDPARIVVERASRNTHENAVESARVAAAHGWRSILLVTSAGHMERALGCFRKVGLTPDALPVDRREDHDDGGWMPRARFLAMSEHVLRELTGRVVYRVQGYM
jgi:uncharacterized SAM-binding protein YcdF (DUF218 family)